MKNPSCNYHPPRSLHDGFFEPLGVFNGRNIQFDGAVVIHPKLLISGFDYRRGTSDGFTLLIRFLSLVRELRYYIFYIIICYYYLLNAFIYSRVKVITLKSVEPPSKNIIVSKK